MTQIKTCAGCGEPFARKPNCDNKRWERQRYCSPTCALQTVGQSDYHSGGATSAESLRTSAAKIGSDALRARILNMFMRTANRRHISLEDAARMHLCPRKAA